VSGLPVKNEHSHPGDAMGYGSAILFPSGLISKHGVAKPVKGGQGGSYFGRSGGPQVNAGQFGPRPAGAMPQHGDPIRKG
jgi:hypothetical protein